MVHPCDTPDSLLMVRQIVHAHMAYPQVRALCMVHREWHTPGGYTNRTPLSLPVSSLTSRYSVRFAHPLTSGNAQTPGYRPVT